MLAFGRHSLYTLNAPINEECYEHAEFKCKSSILPIRENINCWWMGPAPSLAIWGQETIIRPGARRFGLNPTLLLCLAKAQLGQAVGSASVNMNWEFKETHSFGKSWYYSLRRWFGLVINGSLPQTKDVQNQPRSTLSTRIGFQWVGLKTRACPTWLDRL